MAAVVGTKKRKLQTPCCMGLMKREDIKTLSGVEGWLSWFADTMEARIRNYGIYDGELPLKECRFQDQKKKAKGGGSDLMSSFPMSL